MEHWTKTGQQGNRSSEKLKKPFIFIVGIVECIIVNSTCWVKKIWAKHV